MLKSLTSWNAGVAAKYIVVGVFHYGNSWSFVVESRMLEGRARVFFWLLLRLAETNDLLIIIIINDSEFYAGVNERCLLRAEGWIPSGAFFFTISLTIREFIRCLLFFCFSQSALKTLEFICLELSISLWNEIQIKTVSGARIQGSWANHSYCL